MSLSTLKFVRGVSTTAARKSSGCLPAAIEKMNQGSQSLPAMARMHEHSKHHAAEGAKKWRLISIASLPVIVLLSIKLGSHHLSHDPPRTPYVPYEHLHVHRKNYPWRDGKTPLFYNPKVNPIPGVGYEDEQ